MLRLGLLQCDSLGAPHAGIAGDYDVLVGGLVSGRGVDVDLVAFRADESRLPGSVADCDAWLVSGSRRSVYEDLDWITDLRRFTERVLVAEVPLVGLCFGHQLIGQVVGSHVGPAAGGWNLGAVRYDLHVPVPGGDDGDSTVTLIASHQDQVFDLPDDATLVASAGRCPIAGFSIGSALTLQSHPEFVPALAASLYDDRREALGHDVVDVATATLGEPLDNARVGAWIIRFLSSPTQSSLQAVGRRSGR